MEYSYYIFDQIIYLQIKGDLLGGNEDKELLELVQIYQKGQIKYCLFNMVELSHMNSKGLSIILQILNLLTEPGGNVVLIKPAAQVQKLLSITKLVKILKLADSNQEAFEIIEKLNSSVKIA
ncbi:STAS domain-containing protein [Rapidithrix thailandica]|uniref:STAS domain-containing protein n=1 Tax=Rapidithrix thailandica TaxID=413964 RepID=A0AAW9S370_9BACT